METAYVYDPIYLEHDLPSHPENARRLKQILSGLKYLSLEKREREDRS